MAGVEHDCRATAAGLYRLRSALPSALLAATAALAVAGIVTSLARSYAPGQHGNQYGGFWASAFAGVIAVQAAAVARAPRLVTARRARLVAWLAYAAWMATLGVVALVGMAIATPVQAGWMALWFAPLAILASQALAHEEARRAAAQAAPLVLVSAGSGGDGGAHPQTAAKGGRSCCGRPRSAAACCARFAGCVGWSSIFFLAVFGFLLALQAAWSAADQVAVLSKPPGLLLRVPIDGSNVLPRIHIMCVGPASPNASTFVFEAGAGSPGLAYAPLADALAAGGRRACIYDRLGYGWSDTAVNPTTLRRTPLALAALLDAAGEAGPVVLAGHSAGGDGALQFAALFPGRVSGLALMDAYTGAAITLATGFDYSGPAVLATLDAYRAAVPFALPRFGTGTAADKSRTDPKNGAALAALYGSNKEWHAQWVDLKAMQQRPNLGDDLIALSGRPAFWPSASEGAPGGVPTAGWPWFGALPVLLMPATRTLEPPPGQPPLPCVAAALGADALCQAQVRSGPGNFYAKLYLAYAATLSSNTTLAPVEGGHGFPWERPAETAAALLAKFAGV